MKINATVIKSEYCNVEVTRDELFGTFVKELKEVNKHLVPFNHIENGKWQSYLFTDHHNGDIVYTTERDATQEELKLDSFINELRTYYYSKN